MPQPDPNSIQARVFSGMVVTLSISTATYFVSNKFNFGFANYMTFLAYVQALVVGPLIGTWLTVSRRAAHGEWGYRLLNTGLTAGLLAPILFNTAAVPSETLGRTMLPVLALVLVGKWGGRITYGRMQDIKWGWAFTGGLFTFVVANMVGLRKGDPWTLAVAAATASVLIQYLASLWPLVPGEQIPDFILDELKEEHPKLARKAAENAKAAAADDSSDERGLFFKAEIGRGSDDAVRVERTFGRGASASPTETPADATPPRERRSSAARAIWGLSALGWTWAAVAAFVSLGMINYAERELAFVTAGGIVATSLAVFCFSRSFGANVVGIWRGIVRPGIFFTMLGLCPALGVLLGYEVFPSDMQFLPVLLLIGCAISGIGVWLIPVPEYQPAGAIELTDEQRIGRRRRIGATLLTLGAVMVGMLPVQIAVFDHAIPVESRKLVKSAVTPPYAMIAVGLCVAGGIYLGRPRKSRDKAPKLELPLQRTILAPRRDDLDELIQRHFLMIGFRLVNRSRMLWSFERGTWASMFWSSDIRQSRTTVNVAAYDAPEGIRVTCYVDVHMGWGNTPSQKDLGLLSRELDDLERMISDASVRVA